MQPLRLILFQHSNDAHSYVWSISLDQNERPIDMERVKERDTSTLKLYPHTNLSSCEWYLQEISLPIVYVAFVCCVFVLFHSNERTDGRSVGWLAGRLVGWSVVGDKTHVYFSIRILCSRNICMYLCFIVVGSVVVGAIVVWLVFG